MDQRVWHSDPTFPVYPGLNHEESGDNRLVDLSEHSFSQPLSHETESSTSSSIENILGNIVDDVPRRSSVRFTGISTSNGSLRGTPPKLLNSSRFDRLSSYGSKSAPRLELCGKNAGSQQFNMVPTKQYDETLSTLQKENYHLKIQVAVRDRMLDEEGTFPQDREEAVKNLMETQIEVEKLRLENQNLKERLKAASDELKRYAASRPSSKLSETFRSESAAGSEAKRVLSNRVSVGASAMHQRKMESPIPTSLASADSDATFEEWKDELDSTPKKVFKSSPIPAQQLETATQSSFSTTDISEMLAEARQEGYSQALLEMKKKEEIIKEIEKPLGVENGTNTDVVELIQPSSTPDLQLDVTEYRGFPAARMGASSAMSPFKRTALAAGSERATLSSPKALLNYALASSTPFTRPIQQRISHLEKKTFNMLIQRLKELVEFLTHGLSGSFNSSETTLNLSNATFFEANLDISLIPDIGSGDGSHVSFSLATKLQEIIDISREMSLHDVEVETDQHWVSLQEERTSLMEQVEALTKALSAASEAAHTAESEIERLQLVQKASEVDYEKQAVEMEANNETLRAAMASSKEANGRLEEELAELLEKIPALERQMAEHQENQMLIMQHAVRRPDCDAGVGTDILMDDLDEELRVYRRLNENLNEEIDSLKYQLGSVESTKEYLKSRLDELEGVLSQFEASVAVRETLEKQITLLRDQYAKSNQDFAMFKELHDKTKASLKAVTSDNLCLEEEMNNVREERYLEVQELTSQIARLNAELTDMYRSQQSVEEELQTASEDVKVLIRQLKEKEASLTEQRETCLHLRALVNKEKRNSGQQTDETWSSVKAEQNIMIEKLTQLVDQVEFLEDNLKNLKAANESEIRSKEQVTHGLSLTVNRLTEELEKLLAKNESLQNEMAASKETLAMKDEELRQAILKRQRWEKEMQKQVGKTQKVLHQATHNLAAATGYPRGASKGVLNPLSENHRPE